MYATRARGADGGDTLTDAQSDTDTDTSCFLPACQPALGAFVARSANKCIFILSDRC